MGQKKTLKSKTTATRKEAAKKPSPRQRPTNAELRQQLAESLQREDATASENLRLSRELQQSAHDRTEALQQQSATTEILQIIARLPSDLQPVLDTVAVNAARVCGADDVVIWRVEGSLLRRVAHHGPIPLVQAPQLPIDRESVLGRAVLDCQLNHIEDLLTVARGEFPRSAASAERNRIRTVLVTPLLRNEVAIGTILMRRLRVCPFTEEQIALLKIFAAQAVIAIENVRLFKEIQERNAELREALEHQTATSEVLGIISRSPTDVQPVLDAIVESAARVCGIDDVVLRLRDGNVMAARAHFGPMPMPPTEISIDAPEYCWVREHGTLHIPDVRAAQNEFPGLGSLTRSITFLAAPLRQQGQCIGSLNARRFEVRPFTPAQIKLLETFAEQAVIAIENVRLFNELEGGVRTANCNERNPGCNRQLTDGHSAGA